MTLIPDADAQNRIRKYELGQPFVRREQRLAFDAIHRTPAQTWTNSLGAHLPGGATLEFSGVEFATFASVALDRSPSAQLAMFSLAPSGVSGFLMLTASLTKLLVNNRLGLKAASADQAAAPLTRIEASIAREVMRGLLARLGEAYRAANLGGLTAIRPVDPAGDGFIFAPQESLAVLEFRLGAKADDLRILLALNANIVSSLTEPHPARAAQTNSRDTVIDVIKRLPIDIDVVLGSWKVPLRELMQLRAGDKIILPDGEEAWLASRGVRIRRAGIEIIGNRATVEIGGKATPR